MWITLAKIYRSLYPFSLSRKQGLGWESQEKDAPEYVHLCLDIINAFLSPNRRWRSMFSESDSCHRNLDQLQQGGASGLFGDTAIESEGIKSSSVLGLV